jgi:hypothetical protein
MHRLFGPEPLKRQRNFHSPNRWRSRSLYAAEIGQFDPSRRDPKINS